MSRLEEVDDMLDRIAERARVLALEPATPTAYWLDVALKAAHNQVSKEWSLELDPDVTRLAYTAAVFGRTERTAESETFAVSEEIPELRELITEMRDRGIGRDWFATVTETVFAIMRAIERTPSAPAIKVMTTPPGLGYENRRRLAIHVVGEIAEQGLGRNGRAAEVEVLVKCWFYGSFFGAASASLPPAAARELEGHRPSSAS